MSTTGISVSQDLAAFLDARIDADEADVVIAEAFLMQEIDPEDEHAHNYFDLRAIDGSPRITYTTDAKYRRACIQGFSGHPFTHSVGWRIAAKPAAVAQRVTGLDAKDYGRGYDVFSQACVARLIAPQDADIRVVSGEDITYHYHEGNHCDCGRNLGDLGDSCMRYSKCQDRFGIYENNAEMAVLCCPSCEGTRGRALLWCDQDGERWVDRIYAGPADTEILKAWASREGYRSVWSELNHGGVSRQVIVPAASVDYESAPYLDSLPYWCRTCETLSNQPCYDTGHWLVTLRDYMYGTNHEGWNPPCEHCGGTIGYYGRCHNASTCDGCGDWFCGEDCPNGCESCPGCGEIIAAGEECESCYYCSDCGRTNTAAAVGLQLGQCRCGAVLNPAWTTYQPVTMVWSGGGRGYLSLFGTCPDCHAGHSVYRNADGTLDIPSDARSQDGRGNCYNCHRPIQWVVPSLLPATIPPRVPSFSPARLRACVAAMQARCRRELPADVWGVTAIPPSHWSEDDGTLYHYRGLTPDDVAARLREVCQCAECQDFARANPLMSTRRLDAYLHHPSHMSYRAFSYDWSPDHATV